MSDRSNLLEAKSRLSMTALLNQLAPDWRKKNPIRADDKTNSFGASEHGWQDHGTSAKGDQIAFLEKFEGLRRGDAIRRFLELAGVESAPRNGHLHKRSKIDWAALVADLTDDHVIKLAAWRGLSVEFVQWLRARALVGVYEGGFALPENDPETGRLTGVHYLIGQPQDKNWRRIKGTSAQPLIIGDRAAPKWLIFESQWDAFAVMESLDFHVDEYDPPCAILITRGKENGKFASLVPARADAIIVMQNDEEKNGKVAAEDWLSTIKQHTQAQVKVARPPTDVHDCNDWLKNGDADFAAMIAEAKPDGLRAIPLGEITYNVTDDPDELLRRRFMCRGGSALLIGPTGIGKSSFEMQAAVLWSLGKPCFDIEPSRPLTSVIVQAENDDGDLVEMREGVFTGLGLTEAEREIAKRRILVHSENAKTSALLVSQALRPLLIAHRPDLLWLDNLFAYCGCNVSDQEQMTAFLRTLLNPLIKEFRCGLVIVHHTNKPPSGEQKATWKDNEFAYLGSGTNELANWPRAILGLRALNTPGVFELLAPKRGFRLGWRDGEGKRTIKRNIAHAKDGLIYWREAHAEEAPANAGKKKKYFVEDILRLLDHQHLGAVEWQKLCRKEKGISNGTFYELKSEAEDSKRIAKDGDDKWFKVV